MSGKNTVERVNEISSLLGSSTPFEVFSGIVSYLEDISVSSEDSLTLEALSLAYQEYLKADFISGLLNEDVQSIVTNSFKYVNGFQES